MRLFEMAVIGAGFLIGWKMSGSVLAIVTRSMGTPAAGGK